MKRNRGALLLDVGLIGLGRSGKTTVYKLLTGLPVEINSYGGVKESKRALAPIPDLRLDTLRRLYSPKKVTPAQLTVVDVPGLDAAAANAGPNRFLNDVRLVDALILVVRGFESEFGESATPFADIENMELELSLSDLDLLEKRRQRIQTGKKVTKENEFELHVIARLIEAMDAGQRLNQVVLSEEEMRLIRGYQFLTLKPMLWVINLDESTFQNGTFPDQQKIMDWAAEKEIPLVTVAGKMEEEMSELDAGDREVFMDDLGITETGISRIAQAIYARLGLISFLTAGEDEVRAWPIPQGISAKEAAGKIHSDIERGFIRAEIIAFDDLVSSGTMGKAREKGLVRLEGKEYVMKDGDIVNFRFNV